MTHILSGMRVLLAGSNTGFQPVGRNGLEQMRTGRMPVETQTGWKPVLLPQPRLESKTILADLVLPSDVIVVQ